MAKRKRHLSAVPDEPAESEAIAIPDADHETTKMLTSLYIMMLVVPESEDRKQAIKLFGEIIGLSSNQTILNVLSSFTNTAIKLGALDLTKFKRS